jgi:hypothetical protein
LEAMARGQIGDLPIKAAESSEKTRNAENNKQGKPMQKLANQVGHRVYGFGEYQIVAKS